MQKFIYSSAAFLFLFFFFTSANSAQQWSDAQKEIWSNIETYWSFDDSKDLDGFLQYFDESYKGWSYDTEKPMNKNEVREEIKKEFASEKDMKTTTKLTPHEIWVSGDLAFAHYSFSREKVEGDKKENYSGRWTDILKKKGDKWVLVGDHGGRRDKK